jgi:hypothetical protein
MSVYYGSIDISSLGEKIVRSCGLAFHVIASNVKHILSTASRNHHSDIKISTHTDLNWRVSHSILGKA